MRSPGRITDALPRIFANANRKILLLMSITAIFYELARLDEDVLSIARQNTNNRALGKYVTCGVLPPTSIIWNTFQGDGRTARRPILRQQYPALLPASPLTHQGLRFSISWPALMKDDRPGLSICLLGLPFCNLLLRPLQSNQPQPISQSLT